MKITVTERIEHVSTHSRPKAAGGYRRQAARRGQVSTHSRPKAAGFYNPTRGTTPMVSTHSRPKAAGNESGIFIANQKVSTHSRPKAAGWVRLSCLDWWSRFQLTAARRRLVFRGSCLNMVVHSFNSQPPEGGWARCWLR